MKDMTPIIVIPRIGLKALDANNAPGFASPSIGLKLSANAPIIAVGMTATIFRRNGVSVWKTRNTIIHDTAINAMLPPVNCNIFAKSQKVPPVVAESAVTSPRRAPIIAKIHFEALLKNDRIIKRSMNPQCSQANLRSSITNLVTASMHRDNAIFY